MTLGGVCFVIDAIKYDYCIEATIQCLKELCDEVVILDAGSNDGTVELISKYRDEKTMIVELDRSQWDAQHGREKLAYFQNIALSFLNTDYYVLLQADEVISEKWFGEIRRAVNTGDKGFVTHRWNFWKDKYHTLIVPENRQPCSTKIVRIAKTKYLSVGDGESIEVPGELMLIRATINHYGFIRNKYIMKDKVFHMQESVFEIAHDPKLDNCEYFEWGRWFSQEDLDYQPLWDLYHPKFALNWLKDK